MFTDLLAPTCLRVDHLDLQALADLGDLLDFPALSPVSRARHGGSLQEDQVRFG